MRNAVCRNCLGLLALPLLSGCLLINAFLGVAGLVGTGPVQYASSAYSMGEYAYQYAVNDKTPDQVIEEKLAFFIGPFNDPDGQAEATLLAEQDSTTMPKSVISAPIKGPFQSNSARNSVSIVEEVGAVSPAPYLSTHAMVPAAPVRTAARRARPISPHSPVRARIAATVPAPAATAPPSPRPDPLLARMHRLERCLAEAERIASARPETGLRLPATTNDAGRTAPEISGGWSIRHPVMSFAPDAG